MTASTPEELTKVIEEFQNALTGGDQGAFSTETISIQVIDSSLIFILSFFPLYCEFHHFFLVLLVLLISPVS